MAAPNMTKEDWEHRLHVLSSWRRWHFLAAKIENDGAIYRGLLDGCAITVRALCAPLGIGSNFKNLTISPDPAVRQGQLLHHCIDKEGLVHALAGDEQRCVLEVLYLANRAIAHPADGNLFHAAGDHEMSLAIKVLLGWLKSKQPLWPELAKVHDDFFLPP